MEQNIMSTLLTQRETADPALLSALHHILLADCQALPLPGGLYRTLLPRHPHHMELLWRFEPAKGGHLRLSIRPQLTDGPQGSFRIDSQRGFVDLLRALNACNKDKSRSMTFVVTDYCYVEVATMFPGDYLKDARLVRRLVKNTLAQLPAAIDRLLVAVHPFLETQQHQDEPMGNTAKLFLDRSYKLLLDARRSQTDRKSINEQYGQKQVEECRVQAYDKMRDPLRVMGVDATFLRATTSRDASFSQWMNRNKQPQQGKNSKDKNVFSVKLLAETGQTIEKDSSGSHCRIMLATYRLTIAISVNAAVVLATSGLLQEVTRELQLVKKEVKTPARQQSKNSFQNELDFIIFIRDRSCQYVSTYYWQYEIKRQDAAAILMDYYPQNLREMLRNQGKLLSLREKLLLLKRIVAGVNWLAGNHICHRDIKPQNIMISQERLPKLVDFGSCCPVYGAGTAHLQVSQTRLLGTPSYFRPYSQSQAGNYKKQEYEQHLLFDAYSLGRVMRDVLQEGVPRLLPNLESLLVYMMQRCEEEDPADRLTYQEMLYLLENCLQYLEWLEGGTVLA